MGKLNLTDNLFIGTQELKTFQENFLQFKVLLGYLTKTYGFVDLKDLINSSELAEENSNNCWKVNPTTGGTFTISAPSFAFAYPYDLITWNNPSKIIKVSDSLKGKAFWVKIKYSKDNFEQGVLQLDNQGNIIGTNTYFKEKLRGEPNFASVIELYSYDSNSGTWISAGQFTVESVKTDTSIVISSDKGIPNSSISYLYKVVGTFPMGTFVPQQNKYPFIYDSCEVELIEETATNQAPNEGVMMVSNQEFYIARMEYSNDGILSVIDKKDYFENNNLFEPKYSKWWSLK